MAGTCRELWAVIWMKLRVSEKVLPFLLNDAFRSRLYKGFQSTLDTVRQHRIYLLAILMWFYGFSSTTLSFDSESGNGSSTIYWDVSVNHRVSFVSVLSGTYHSSFHLLFWLYFSLHSGILVVHTPYAFSFVKVFSTGSICRSWEISTLRCLYQLYTPCPCTFTG